MPRRKRGLLCLALAAMLLPLFGGCGYKAPPQPLLKPLPEGVRNLAIDQLGDAFRLTWQLPTRNQDGSPLTDLQRIVIYRNVTDPDNRCLDCPSTGPTYRSVDLDFLGTVQRSGNRLWLLDRNLEPGVAYHYSLVPLNRGGQPGLASNIRAVPQPVIPAPAHLRVSGKDRLVQLNWDPLPVEGKLLGYRIYRGRDGAALDLQSLTPKPLTETEFQDTQVDNGTPYRYGVRAVVRGGESGLESPLSNLAEAIPTPGR